MVIIRNVLAFSETCFRPVRVVIKSHEIRSACHIVYSKRRLNLAGIRSAGLLFEPSIAIKFRDMPCG